MDLFEIGKVLKPRGLKGQMRCFSHLESDGLRKSPEEVCLKTPGGGANFHRLREITFAGKYFFLSVEGVDSPEAVQALAGSDVLAPVDVLIPLAEDEYYWRDIIGLDVVTDTGQPLGKVKEIFATGSNDVYVCHDGNKEILLPAIEDVILKIDLVEKRIVVHLLEGL
jgi:16S rRNA processing protein RimM